MVEIIVAVILITTIIVATVQTFIEIRDEELTQMIALEDTTWRKVIDRDTTVADMLAIIDDAQCHGFEFKVENHSIYWRYTKDYTDIC